MKQYGPEILVKTNVREAKGFVVLFGVRQTYLNTYSGKMLVSPTRATDVLSTICEAREADACGSHRQIPGAEISSEHEEAALVDVDAIRSQFPPERTLTEVEAGLRASGIPCRRCDDELYIYRRSDDASLVGSVYLLNNLWYLAVPLLGRMRVADSAINDLIYEVEAICDRGANVAMEVLVEAYGVWGKHHQGK